MPFIFLLTSKNISSPVLQFLVMSLVIVVAPSSGTLSHEMTANPRLQAFHQHFSRVFMYPPIVHINAALVFDEQTLQNFPSLLI